MRVNVKQTMKQKLPYYFEATDKIFEFAKELRHSQTSSEKYLWQILRNRKIDGLT
jgi:very-short-patch-repair endonuclease